MIHQCLVYTFCLFSAPRLTSGLCLQSSVQVVNLRVMVLSEKGLHWSPEVMMQRITQMMHRKKVFLNTFLLTGRAPVSRALVEMFMAVVLMLLTQHPFSSLWIKKSFPLSCLITFKRHFLRLQLSWTVVPLLHLGKSMENLLERSHHSRSH